MAHKSHYDPAKEKWREAWYQFIRKHQHSLRGSPQDWQVVFFPGEEALELDVYDRLKIPRENLLGLERDPEVHEKLRKKNFGIRLTDEPIDAKGFFEQTDERFDIANFDYEGTLNPEVVKTLEFIAGKQLLQENGLFLINTSPNRPDGARAVEVGSFMGENLSDSLRAIHMGNISAVMHPEQALEQYQQTPKKERRGRALTNVVQTIFFKGRSNLMTLPIYQKNPQYADLEGIANFTQNQLGVTEKNSRPFRDSLHFKALVDHFMQSGFGNREWAYQLARVAVIDQKRAYFPLDMVRTSYVSKNGTLMFSDIVYFSQLRGVVERYSHLAEHAYVDLTYRNFLLSLCGGKEVSRARAHAMFDRLGRDLTWILEDAQKEIEKPRPRTFLGSSARVPKLDGPTYYQERIADMQKDVPFSETKKRLLRDYKVSPSQITAFDYWAFTEGKYGPTDLSPNGTQQKPLEVIVAVDKFELVPHQYWNRLPDNFKQRIVYFIQEDLARADLQPEQTRRLVGEIRASKWYKTLNGNQLSNSQFHAFFDDILLELIDGNVPNRKKIQEMFEDVMKPNWREKGISKVKPVLTLSEYERLSFYEGRSDDWILGRYSTPKPNSIRSYKAWVTMRHGEKKQKDNLGEKVAVLIRQRRSKEKIMEEVGLSDYQYRGFLAAYKRGAYKHLFREQQPQTPMPRIYIDSHGVVHVNPKNAGDIEKGYK